MAAVKSKSGIYCSSKFEDKAERMNTSKNYFTLLDIFLILFSMVAFIVDLSTDIYLVVEYFKHGHTYWAVSTFLLIILPATVIQMFSMRWHVMDETVSLYHWLAHIFLLGIIHRYVNVLKTGFEARASGDPVDFQRLYHQQNDICMLHLFESFMESAPQLVLQLYIMTSMEAWQSWTGVSAAASLASLAWAIAAYTRAMRRARPDKTHVSWPGLVCQAVWRGGMVTARIATLVLFAVGFQAWLFVLLGFHWLGMTVWIVCQRTDFCPTPWEECIYNCVVGVIYCFSFFNLQEGQSRYRALTFYVIIISQNLGCLGLFLALAGVTRTSLVKIAAGIIIGGTVLGMTSMLLYYRFFHPAGSVRLCTKSLQHNIESGTNEQAATLRSLKHCTLSRMGGTSPQQGSPQSDDVSMDKKQLLTHCVMSPSESEDASTETTIKQKRRGICSPLELGLEESMKEEGENHPGVCSLEPNLERKLEEDKQKRRGICTLDADLSLDETPNKEREKFHGVCSLDPGYEYKTEDDKKKRRGICSLEPEMEVELELGISLALNEEELEKKNAEAETPKDVKQIDEEAPSEVLSVPSEVLSAHDYENICAVNIAREAWGLRSWRAYSDIETWLHDDSVVRDRRRDTLTSTTSASSEHSIGNVDRQMSSSPPPAIPCRRPACAPRTRQDDYLDTLVDDLACCETGQVFTADVIDPNVFMAKPYVVDQHGTFFPLGTLDTIVEELEESSSSTDPPHGSASTLVATIDEIRHGNLWEVSQYQNDQPQCRVPLSPEEVLFLSKLQPLTEASPEPSPAKQSPPKPNPEIILNAAPYLDESEQTVGSLNAMPRKRPRRKFSLLREKFEIKQQAVTCIEMTQPIVGNSKLNIEEKIKQWNNFLNAYSSEPDNDIVKSRLRDRKSMFLKQVLSPTWGKKGSLSPKVKVVPAT